MKKSVFWKKPLALGLALAALTSALGGCGTAGSAAADGKSVTITNVSYDPTRELYESYNKMFQKYWKAKTGQDVTVTQSHGGSGKQARSVLEGNDADVVTLALQYDVDMIAQGGLIDKDWIKKLPDDSAPYTSTIVFLVRKGNPKQIRDWNDVVKPGVEVITPNPKTSGGARWNFLAAWAYAKKQYGGDEAKTQAFVKALYQNVSVLDTGARGATTTFVENKKGDVLLAWENEAFLAQKENPGQFEVVTPSISILAQPSVAVVDQNAKQDGTEAVSKAYLTYLYSDEAQRLEAQNFYRPVNQKILKEFSGTFNLNMKLATVADFGGWSAVNKKFFADGAIFDQIYSKK